MSEGAVMTSPRSGEPSELLAKLLAPERVWTRDEVRGRPSRVPQGAGVYGWYFREVPARFDTSECARFGDLVLLYIGISPSRPVPAGDVSKRGLRTRIRTHYRSNISASTLRYTLACLLQERLGLRFAITASGRLSIGDGESALSAWMSDSAFVTWVETPEPWVVEEEAIRSVNLPLNLSQNKSHGFAAELSALRSAARLRALSQ